MRTKSYTIHRFTLALDETCGATRGEDIQSGPLRCGRTASVVAVSDDMPGNWGLPLCPECASKVKLGFTVMRGPNL